MTQRISFSSIVLALSVAVIIGPAVPPAAGDEPPELLCEGRRATQHPLPALIDPGDVVWELLYEIGIGPERVAVVVWHDPVGDPPDGLYYGTLQSSIDTYAADVAAAGFTVAVYKFYGMAEDPDHPDAGDLRRRLRQMWEEEEKSLAGAVLVGNVSHLLYETIGSNDFPSDRLLCDMDGEIYDYEQTLGWRAGVFDTWVDEDQEIEIWTSRIMARPELVDYAWEESYTQVELLVDYFARNHSDRWNAFNSSGEALLYSIDGIGAEWVDVLVLLEQLYGDLTAVCPDPLCPDGDPSWQDYVEIKLPYQPGYGHIQITSHGPPWATEHYLDLERAAVTREHYRDIDPNTMSWVFECCYPFDFANPDDEGGACLGEVIVFNPEAPTLVGFGSTRSMTGTNFIPYYSPLTEGRCQGEGYKDVVNAPENWYAGGFVLLGDGTLKNFVTWTGEGSPDLWSIPDNWSSGEPPTEIDSVLHINNDDVIQMDIGDPAVPTEIVGFVGDGALGGGLWIVSQRALRINGDAVLSNGYDVTLQAGAGQENPTKLTTQSDIFGGEFTLNDDSLLQVAPPSGRAVHGNALGASFTLNDESVLEVAGVMDRCGVVVGGPDALVEATGGITGGPSTNGQQDWTIDSGTVVAGPSTLWGDWQVTGGSVTFERMSANQEYGITMKLQDGAHVQIEEMPYDGWPTFPGVHGPPSKPRHELVYGPGANEFAGGTGSPPPWEVMYFGDYTVIRPLDEQEGNTLNLDLSCELYIVSDFQDSSVYGHWDTLGVDITARPIEDSEPPNPPMWCQCIELISPDFAPWYDAEGGPVIFLDVPCHGTFRDLTITDLLPEDPTPAATWMANSFDNSAIDEVGTSGVWAEAGLFRNVTVGALRTLSFAAGNGVIYYYDTADIDTDATILYYEGSGDPLVVTDTTDPAIDDLIVPAVGTIYGDWNGDCQITNAELGDLQKVIAGGSSTYNPLMDDNCDGYILTVAEVAHFLTNMAIQPPCGRGSGDGGGGGGAGAESWTESYEGYDDVPGLAAWLIEVLSEEQLEAFVADLTAAAAEFADSPVGQDLAELLFWLQ